MRSVRTFRAASMHEALELVRRELGSEAVILQTRQLARRRFLPWRRPVEEVEITAGLDINVVSALAGGGAGGQSGETQGSALRSRESAVSGQRSDPQPSTLDSQPANGSPLATRHSPTSPHPQPDVNRRLDSIQRLLEKLGRGGRLGSAADVPPELFGLYTELIEADVEESVARELVLGLRGATPREELHDLEAVRRRLEDVVQAALPPCRAIVPVPGVRKVVALVGATGVGKTTTIAKLAANFRLRENIRLGLVTVDTYRIAAVEQLRTYADIIDLPMKVVTSPPEMRRAMDELSGLDLVLIDTAGRSPRDEMQIQELKSLLSEAGVDEVHLVLSLTTAIASLQASVEKFRPAGPTSIIVSKLDEAAGMGGLFALAQNVELPFSYLTTGQDVPEDIEPASAERITRLVLGRERIGG